MEALFWLELKRALRMFDPGSENFLKWVDRVETTVIVLIILAVALMGAVFGVGIYLGLIYLIH